MSFGESSGVILKTVSDEQRNDALKLTGCSRAQEINGSGSSSCDNNGQSGSASDSSDDIIILDGSDDEVEVLPMDDCSELSSGSSSSKSTKNSGISEIVVASSSADGNTSNDIPPSPAVVEAAVLESESEESEPESDCDWEVIKIDDEKDDKPRKIPTTMTCLRCPNSRIGTFKDVRKYWVHVERHILPDHFACPTCQRPFVKFNYCLSHEIRVHKTPLEFESKDAVISKAKMYVKNRAQRQQTEGNEDLENTQQQKNETDNETDSEDVQFYNDRFIASTTMYPYRGPEVNTMLEAYEVQLAALRAKSNRANGVAKIAITIHEQNVTKGQDCYKLGKFLKRKRKLAAPAPKPGSSKPVNKAKATKSSAQPVPPPQPPAVKRPRDSISDNDVKEKPTKKRKVVRYISSSSSSSSDEDSHSDYDPTAENKSTKKTRSKDGAGPSELQQQKKLPQKKGSENSTESVTVKRLSALLSRECQLCGYAWPAEYDLRLHRDLMHPTARLMDLMTFPYELPTKPKAAQGVKKSVVEGSSSSGSKRKDPPKKVAATTKGKKRKDPVSGANQLNRKRKVAARKGRSQVATSRSKVPLPDDTFSEKETYLHALNLTSCVRLHLHQKKPVSDLKLPECTVRLKRMSEWEIAMCRFGGASSLYNDQQDYVPQHFLLG